MSNLKLRQLPDRTLVKITITIMPELAANLNLYAAHYEQAYGTTEPVTELIPAMLAMFLESDRAFQKRRRSSMGRNE